MVAVVVHESENPFRRALRSSSALRHLYLHLHLHRHLLGRLCRLRVRRGAVCSSLPSVCRPPLVENHVFPVACYVASRGVAVARLFVSLADNRAITRVRDN